MNGKSTNKMTLAEAQTLLQGAGLEFAIAVMRYYIFNYIYITIYS